MCMGDVWCSVAPRGGGDCKRGWRDGKVLIGRLSGGMLGEGLLLCIRRRVFRLLEAACDWFCVTQAAGLLFFFLGVAILRVCCCFLRVSDFSGSCVTFQSEA
jgi:hypothetical protein